jgi:hypothetical protein
MSLSSSHQNRSIPSILKSTQKGTTARRGRAKPSVPLPLISLLSGHKILKIASFFIFRQKI